MKNSFKFYLAHDFLKIFILVIARAFSNNINIYNSISYLTRDKLW